MKLGKPWHSSLALIFGVSLAALVCLPASLQAQTTQPAPSAPTATPSNDAKPGGSGAAPAAQSPAAPAEQGTPPVAAEPDSGAAPGIPNDAVTQTLEVPAQPVAFMRGAANWDEGYKTIRDTLAKINTEIDKASLKPAGHPIAVFVETDDNGFKFEAMVPLAAKPDGLNQLSDSVKIGASPAGKALKFQHRGAYDDIDSTYDLITAFLDEKELEAQNLFIEEYLTDAKTSDDSNLEVDIYVFIK